MTKYLVFQMGLYMSLKNLDLGELLVAELTFKVPGQRGSRVLLLHPVYQGKLALLHEGELLQLCLPSAVCSIVHRILSHLYHALHHPRHVTHPFLGQREGLTGLLAVYLRSILAYN